MISDEIHDLADLVDHNTGPAGPLIENRKYAIPQQLFDAFIQQKLYDNSSSFRDVALVQLRSGNGGSGCINFLRQSNQAVGPPDGGDGGRGGDVYVKAEPGLTSLRSIRHMYNAENGQPGAAAQLTGRNGRNVVLQVPVGTTIRWAPSLKELRRLYKELPEAVRCSGRGELVSEQPFNITYTRFGEGQLQLKRNSYPDGFGWHFKDKDESYFYGQRFFQQLADKVRHLDTVTRRTERDQDVVPENGIELTEPGQTYRLLAGGLGGLGNIHFQSSDIRSPRFAKIGRAGLAGTFFFEMRLVADLGLVGLPNAGKSTLLRAISRARPRVGHWEFTTLRPSLGTVDMGIARPTFTVADIPGIVQGASDNRGLGIGFLRHIERCRGLVFVVALDRADPGVSLEILLRELGPERLEGKRALVVATKGDMPGAEQAYAALVARAAELSGEHGLLLKTVPCCAQLSESNIEQVLEEMSATAAVSEATTRTGEIGIKACK